MMEQTIGDLGSNIRQPSNIYGNLTQIAVWHSQLNALKNACPELDPDNVPSLLQHSQDCGDGFIFFWPCNQYRTKLKGEVLAIIQDEFDTSRLRWWGRLRMLNGQVAQSVFSEMGWTGNVEFKKCQGEFIFK